MEHEEIGSLTGRRKHGGERLVGMAVQGHGGATQERVPDVECTEQSLSHERLVIPHRMLRGRRGHGGWGPGGPQACRTPLAAERASELQLPSLEVSKGRKTLERGVTEKPRLRTESEGVGASVPLRNASCPTGSRRPRPRGLAAACAGRGQMTTRLKRTV